jgi:hypothetical protein
MRVEYQLTVGISRTRSSLSTQTAASHLSQVMKIPLRVYNRVYGKLPTSLDP